MIARFTTIAIEESDRGWFADHRRQFRWRPAEPWNADTSVIARREGEIIVIPVPPSPGLWGAGDDVLGALFAAYRKRKKAGHSDAPGHL
jgi:hypothetical protein